MPNLLIHIVADLLLAGLIVFLFKKFRAKNYFLKISGILIATNLIDLDHLLANPIYDPLRCSINFHPLHSLFILPLYLIGLIFPKTRIISLGILVHLALDGIQCLTLLPNI